jgi:hypothetical protein
MMRRSTRRALFLWNLASIASALTLSEVAFSQGSPAETAKPSEDESIESIDRGIRELDTLWQQGEAMMAVERDRCLNAFGHERFCECILGPMVLGFRGYVAAVTMTEVEFRQATLDAETRDLFARARAIRNKCVAETIKKSPQPSDISVPPVLGSPPSRGN